MCFEVGDAAVLEAQVGPGGVESFIEGAVVGGELVNTLLERGVLRADALNPVLGPVRFEVTDAAEEFADACALGDDLGGGGLEPVLGVERPLTPAGPPGVFRTPELRLDHAAWADLV